MKAKIMPAVLGGFGLAGLGWLAVFAVRKALGPGSGTWAEAADPGAGGNVRLLPAEPAGIA